VKKISKQDKEAIYGKRPWRTFAGFLLIIGLPFFFMMTGSAYPLSQINTPHEAWAFGGGYFVGMILSMMVIKRFFPQIRKSQKDYLVVLFLFPVPLGFFAIGLLYVANHFLALGL
jgi:hypothetical protein